MADAAITFDPDFTFTSDHKLVITGSASDSVSKIELFNQATGQPVDLGSAQISGGSWSFTQNIGAGLSTDAFVAEVTDTSGTTTKVGDSTIAVAGITGNPFTSFSEDLSDETHSIPLNFYSDSGTLEYHGDLKGVGTSSSFSFSETGDQVHAQFVFVQASDTSNITQTITNFHVDGNSHDTVLLPHADFANMADLLRNTTMSGGNAVIHDPNNTATLTLMGVTKTEMKAHQNDFSFHGSGQLTQST